MSECLITNNVSVTFETMHHINQKKSRNVGEMVVELDMSKVYDKVDWGCLEKIMIKMGSHLDWVNTMMMHDISILCYQNQREALGCHILPSRRLCQGDPLSPYLFLICANYLSSLLRK